MAFPEKALITSIGRYTALLGLACASLLHLAGYFYLDLPYPAFVILALGIVALVPLAFRQPFPKRPLPIDTVAKKAALGLAIAGLTLWLLMTFLWLAFVRTPNSGIGPHPIRFSTLWPLLNIGGRHYRMLYQQWQTLADALVYTFFWLWFSSRKAPVLRGAPTLIEAQSGATGVFPLIVRRLIAGSILASLALIVVGWALHSVGLVEKSTSEFMAGLSLLGFVAALALTGLGMVLAALRG